MNPDPTRFFAMHTIDDTITRSRQAVEDSLSLAKRNAERKEVLEKRLKAFMQKQEDTRRKDSEVSELHSFYVEGRTREQGEADQGKKAERTVERKEQSTQRDVTPPRNYLTEIDSLRSELAHEREWRAHFCEIERALTQRICEQDSRIAELETKLHESTSPRAVPDSTDEPSSYISALRRDMGSQHSTREDSDHARRQRAAFEWEDSLASLRERSRKIEELEDKLKSSKEKYEEMKRRVTSPRPVRRNGDLAQSAKYPLETHSFDDYLYQSTAHKRSSPALHRPTSGAH